MLKRIIATSILIAVCIAAYGMEREDTVAHGKVISTHRVSSFAPVLHPVTKAHLAEIMPTSQCIAHGRITALVVHHLPEWYKKVHDLRLHNQEVTMIRTDVSDALGGAHITGDTIHVDGIDLGENTLEDGSIITIAPQDDDEPSVVLLKTFTPYFADAIFQNRCGKLAHDFMRDEGEYVGGSAVQDRLRGVRLALVKGGSIAVGDLVQILSQDESEIFLQKMQLHERAQELASKNLPIAERLLCEFQKNKTEWALIEQTARQNPYTTWSGIACIGGVAMVMVLILVGGSF